MGCIEGRRRWVWLAGLAFVAILCIAVGAGASAAINNAYDTDIDRVMVRTRLRPTASGRISAADALATGITLAIGAVTVMAVTLGPESAAAPGSPRRPRAFRARPTTRGSPSCRAKISGASTKTFLAHWRGRMATRSS